MKKMKIVALLALLPALTAFKAEAVIYGAGAYNFKPVETILESEATMIGRAAKVAGATCLLVAGAYLGVGALGMGLGTAGMLTGGGCKLFCEAVFEDGSNLYLSENNYSEPCTEGTWGRAAHVNITEPSRKLVDKSLTWLVAPYTAVKSVCQGFCDARKDDKHPRDEEKRLPKQ